MFSKRCAFVMGVVLVSIAITFAQSNVAQPATISSVEAKSLVQSVLKNRNIHLSEKYCELETLDRDGKPFVANYYTFGASCDYPHTAATTPFGIYVVSPRTGDVWEFNTCEQFRVKSESFCRLLLLRVSGCDGKCAEGIARSAVAISRRPSPSLLLRTSLRRLACAGTAAPSTPGWFPSAARTPA
jgi:hypothetical protein